MKKYLKRLDIDEFEVIMYGFVAFATIVILGEMFIKMFK